MSKANGIGRSSPRFRRKLTFWSFQAAAIALSMASLAWACVSHSGSSGASHHYVVNLTGASRPGNDNVGGNGCVASLVDAPPCIGDDGNWATPADGAGQDVTAKNGDVLKSYFDRTPEYSAAPLNTPEGYEVTGPWKVVIGSGCDENNPQVAQLAPTNKANVFAAAWTLNYASTGLRIVCVTGPVGPGGDIEEVMGTPVGIDVVT